MWDELLFIQHELEQRLVGMNVGVFYPLVESFISLSSGGCLLGLVDHHHFRFFFNLADLFHLDPTFSYHVEIFARQENLVLPRL